MSPCLPNTNVSFSASPLKVCLSVFLLVFKLWVFCHTNSSSVLSGCQRQKDIMQNRKELLKKMLKTFLE